MSHWLVTAVCPLSLRLQTEVVASRPTTSPLQEFFTDCELGMPIFSLAWTIFVSVPYILTVLCYINGPWYSTSRWSKSLCAMSLILPIVLRYHDNAYVKTTNDVQCEGCLLVMLWAASSVPIPGEQPKSTIDGVAFELISNALPLAPWLTQSEGYGPTTGIMGVGMPSHIVDCDFPTKERGHVPPDGFGHLTALLSTQEKSLAETVCEADWNGLCWDCGTCIVAALPVLLVPHPTPTTCSCSMIVEKNELGVTYPQLTWPIRPHILHGDVSVQTELLGHAWSFHKGRQAAPKISFEKPVHRH